MEGQQGDRPPEQSSDQVENPNPHLFPPPPTPPVKKQPNQNYRKSAGKVQDVTCRICNKVVKYQNYKAHLRSKHPEENSKNLRGKSDNPIENIFPSLKRKSLAGASEDEIVPAKKMHSSTDTEPHLNQNQASV